MQYPSARPSIEHMIDYIPRIKPLLYSIASSLNESPDSITLCIVWDGQRPSLCDPIWRGQSERSGDMALFFGALYRANEFLYESEWEQFHDSGRGPLKHLRTVFSRDQKDKVYIQDRIMEDPELIYEYLVNQKGSSAVQDLSVLLKWAI